MSMVIPDGTKLTSPLPKEGSFKSKNSVMKRYLEGNEKLLQNISGFTNRSATNDRLIDYQSNKNARMSNLSTHEKFNIGIMSNQDQWGAEKSSKKALNQSVSKPLRRANKLSIMDEILNDDVKQVGQKQRLLKLKLKGGHALPPPPFGQSMGHGILKKLKAKRSSMAKPVINFADEHQ